MLWLLKGIGHFLTLFFFSAENIYHDEVIDNFNTNTEQIHKFLMKLRNEEFLLRM